MATLNPAYVEAAKDLITKSPFLRLMGVEVIELREGYYRARCELDRKLTNAFGGINGGVNAALLDSATYWCLLCSMPENIGYTTIDLSVNDLHAARSGFIYSEGEVIKRGRTISLTEGRVLDEDGRLVAYGTSKLFAAPTIQPLSEAYGYLGVDPLPKKFLDA